MSGDDVRLKSEPSVQNVEADSIPSGEAISHPNVTATLPIQVANATSDDPWSRTVVDQLGVSDDASAFARLIAAKSFSPPVAIGVFGAWGAGKSFFMREIHEHIEQLKKSADEGLDKPLFHDNIVQIRFNAWHYSETNLWASLVDHVFTKLGQHIQPSAPSSKSSLLDKLNTAKVLTIEAVDEVASRHTEQQRAQKALDEAELVLAKAREDVATSARIATLGGIVAEDELLRNQLREAAKAFGLDALLDDAKIAAANAEELGQEIRRGRVLWRGFVNLLGSGWNATCFALLLLVTPPLAVLGVQKLLSEFDATGAVPAYVTALSAVVTTLAGIFSYLARALRQNLDALERANARLEEEVLARTAKEQERRMNAEKDVQFAAAQKEAAVAAFQAASERLAQAKSDLLDSSNAQRLINFIRARATDGHYASHLGLISSVRRDLEQLSQADLPVDAPEKAAAIKVDAKLKAKVEQLKATAIFTADADIGRLDAMVAPPVEPAEVPFDRLVLYIDDLDRCIPEKVVDVLQAVHMLLAFKLFVVVVAVDVGWAAHALRSHYPDLLSDGQQGRAASAGDYLEKIFQIPYWVRTSDEAGTKRLIRSLLTGPSREFESRDESASLTRSVPAELLEISPEDQASFESFAPYLSASPRKILRLVNVYRLIKANRASGPFWATVPGAEGLLVSQLTAATVDPATFERWFKHLQSQQGVSGEQALQEFAKAERLENKNFVAALEHGLRKFSDLGAPTAEQLSVVKQAAELARRFSFSQVALRGP